ncbi:metallophosphoesterase [Paenibacillus amylolyticus]|nr:metallophosphoesterase [Paenibacillus amylolyticus]
MNSNENSSEYANFSNEQVAWMKQDVEEAKAAGAEWIIVNIHKGLYTTSNHATDSDIIGANGVRNKIAPLMNELGIDLVLQGHDHIYARTKPIKVMAQLKMCPKLRRL